MPNLDFDALRNTRATHPEAVQTALNNRSQRELLGDDGKLMLVAADHPARAALGIGQEAMAMADREDLLHRLAIALETRVLMVSSPHPTSSMIWLSWVCWRTKLWWVP